MNSDQIIEGLAALPLIVRGSRDEVFKAIRELQQEARKVNIAAPAAPSPAEPHIDYREPHVFDPIGNGVDECECGLVKDSELHVVAALRTSVEGESE